MVSGEKVLTYINLVKQLASILKSMDVLIGDKELAMAVLNGLPRNFESLIVALDALGNDDKAFTFEFVKSRLLQCRTMEAMACGRFLLVGYVPRADWWLVLVYAVREVRSCLYALMEVHC